MSGIEPATATTDILGKASFTLTSTEEGQFELTAKANNTNLPKKLTVTFRKD
jgi:hypothetical protein